MTPIVDGPAPWFLDLVEEKCTNENGTSAEAISKAAGDELRHDSREEERSHDDADSRRACSVVLEEEGEEGKTESCAHPLQPHHDLQSTK